MANGKKSPAVATAVGVGVSAQVVGSNDERMSVIIVNNSAGLVYLGAVSTVTAANGIPLTAGSSLTDTTSGDPWWVFNPQAGTADIRVLETTND